MAGTASGDDNAPEAGDRLMRAVIAGRLLLAAVPCWPVASSAQPDEPKIITMSCDGKMVNARTSDATPEPISKLGVVVNLSEKTVSFAGYKARIDNIDAANISFSGERQLYGRIPIAGVSVAGNLDRVTGAMQATIFSTATTFTWDVLCRPTTRLF